MVPVGTRLTYVGTYMAFLRTDPDVLIQKIRQPLEEKWGVVIERGQTDPGYAGFFQAPEILLAVRLVNAYGAADDVRRVIDGEVFATGNDVTSSRITTFQLPGQTSQATGAPGPLDAGNDSEAAKNKKCGGAAELLGLCEGFDFSTVLIIGFVVMFSVLVLAVFMQPTVPARVARSFAR